MADKILGRVDENRRGFVKRLLGVSFAAPVIATFSIDALTSSSAQAQVSQNQNQTFPFDGTDSGNLEFFSFFAS